MLSHNIVFTAPQQTEIVPVDLPAPGPGEVQIAALASLISTGTELICWQGQRDDDSHWATYGAYPHSPGYSTVGRVLALGEGVQGLAPGDRVFSICSHRQFANVPADQLWSAHIPDEVTNEEAAWASLAVITQTGVRQAEHALGERAVVLGLGPLGQLVVQYLRTLGLREVLVADPVQWRLDLALAHGATAGLCGTADQALDFVREHTEGDLADVVYDVTGHWAVLPQALPLARRHGRLLLLGDSPHPSRQCLTSDVLMRKVRIIGSQSSDLPPAHAHWTPQRQVDLFYTYLQRGQMNAQALITQRFPVEEAPQVYPWLYEHRGDTLGVILDWHQAG